MKDVDIYLTNDTLENIAAQFEKGCDVVMYNRILPDEVFNDLKKLQQKYGFKICLDVDDYWHLDTHHVLYDYYQDIEFAMRQIEHIKHADVILTTHPRLAFEVALINPNVHVCPNAIPKQGQFNITREYSAHTRLFWQGSRTHVKDVEILEHPIEQLKSIAGKIKMVIGGIEEIETEDSTEEKPTYQMIPEWQRMAEVYTAGFKHQYKMIPGEPVTNYYSMYAHVDICLVPLVRSKFNSFKSNLKILEAANLGLPVIASDVDPYKNLPINYCRSSKDWVGHVKRLVQFPARQKEEGERLKDYADSHFNFEKINTERKQILEYETKKISA